MLPTRRRFLLATSAMALASSVSSCGTIIYPERKGQIDGRIDPSIAILDGLGLLLFLIPGVIAFAVDFSNGTIYLPGTQTSKAEDEIKSVKYAGELTEAKLDHIWLEAYGEPKSFAVAETSRRQLHSPDDITSELVALVARDYAFA